MPVDFRLAPAEKSEIRSVDDPDSHDDLGRSQAETAAISLLDLGELQIISSPLKRAQETAAAYAQKVQGESEGLH